MLGSWWFEQTFPHSDTIQDFDANNLLISTGCFVHSARRLSAPVVPGQIR